MTGRPALPKLSRAVKPRPPNLIAMEAEAVQAEEGSDDAPPPHTPEELSDGIARLLDEVHSALLSDRWAILDRGTEHVTWLLYDGAALRHCCRPLYELEVAAETNC
jgi:hypothetical protein